MKKFLVMAAALVSLSVFAAPENTSMTLPIRGVADGDTIRSSVKLPCPLCAVSVRIRGIDTPESSHLAKCPAEKEKSAAAKAFLITLVGTNTTMVAKNVKWDKYGGRIDAIVEINGVDIGKEMIAKGFAKPYSGTGDKPNWCN
jgi:endonuclease YncB( thermonuclease family)